MSNQHTTGFNEARKAVVIEDDADIRGLITTVLRQAGFEVEGTESGLAGVELVHSTMPDIVTLDVGLTDIDGLEVARRIRRFSDCYIVMLTAQGEEADLLFGLESGADDYIVKPFRPRELRARIEAMMRRPRTAAAEVPAAPVAAAPAAAPAAPVAPATPERVVGEYRHNGLRLNVDTRLAELAGATLDLTRTEFDLLASLLESGRRVRSKSDLVRELRSGDYMVNDYVGESEERAIEVHFGNLRRKLGDSAREPAWIETVRGVGYRLAPDRAAL